MRASAVASSPALKEPHTVAKTRAEFQKQIGSEDCELNVGWGGVSDALNQSDGLLARRTGKARLTMIVETWLAATRRKLTENELHLLPPIYHVRLAQRSGNTAVGL